MRTVDETQYFEVFLAAVRTGSVAAAAQELSISPSAASRRLVGFEKMMGGSLFERETNGVKLNSRGIRLLEPIEDCMKRFRQLCNRAVPSAKTQTDPIRISAPSSIGNGLLIGWITAFESRHPDVVIDLTLTLGPVRMMPHGCDLRISHGLFPCERVITRHLGFMQRMMVASPRYLAEHGVPHSPEDLIHHSLLGGNDLLDGRPLVVHRGKERVVIPYLPRLRLHDHAAARSAALAGAGIAVHAFRYDTLEYVRRGRLVEVLSDWIPDETPVSMLLPVNRPVRAVVQELADFIENKWHTHPELTIHERGPDEW